MNESTSFFSDPKVIISLLALLIATISIVWSLANQWEQNRKWDELNEGKPEIIEFKLANWKEWTTEEAMLIKWGYEPLLYGKEVGSEYVVAPYKIVLRDSESNELIKKVNKVFTLSEVDSELKRIGYKGKVTAFKMFRPLFKVENIGKTDVNNLSITIDLKLPEQDWKKRFFTSNTKINLSSSQKSTVYFDMDLAINYIPEYIKYRIKFEYDDYKDNNITKEIGVRWTSKDNFWTYESLK